MIDGVNTQESARPELKENKESQAVLSEKSRENFRRLEEAREAERERAIRAETQAQMMQAELNQLKIMLQPKEKDHLEEVEDIDDPDKLKKILHKERQLTEKRAKEIAKQAYEQQKREEEEKRREEDKKNYLPKLRNKYSDYDDVMSEENFVYLSKKDPIFLKTALKIQDDYERREATYEYLKANPPKTEPTPSIQDKVAENLQNPYFINTGFSHGNSAPPSAIDFDVSSAKARNEAYSKLKAAQKRPITANPMNR